MYKIRFAPVIIISLALCANAAPPADQIFPDTTKGFVAIKNLEDFAEQWQQTQFGQLMSDPLMEDFKRDAQKQLTERLETTFGLTFDGIASLPSGELALGMIAIPSTVPGYALTMNIAGKRKETDEYLDNLSKKLIAAGVKKTTETYRGQQITVLTFPPPDPPPALPGIRVQISFEPIERKAYYMLWQDILIASDQLHLIQLIADRLAGQNTARALATVEAYQVVMRRCIGDMPAGASPILRWYVEPLDYGESVRIAIQNRRTTPNHRERPSIFAILKQQGFDAIRGIGGVVSIKAEEQESVYRTFIYTQKPYRLAMRMLDFPNQTNFAPPTWMPKDLARCTMFYVDPQAIFDNFGVLFDAVVMPGEEGLWADILRGLRDDPLGPQIDIREELIVHLGNRVFGMSRYEKPITINSEHMVIAVELKPGQERAMLAGVEKLFGKDQEMMATEHRSYKIWHRKPMEDLIAPIINDFPPDIFGDSSSDGSVAPLAIIRGQQPMEDEDRPPMFPEGSVVVAKGCLFVSTDIEYLKEVLDRLDMPVESSIRDEAEYQSVNQIFAKMGLADKPHFFQFFARAHETLRPSYEMIRLGRMAQNQALLGKLLNEFLAPEEEEGVRRQLIDGSSLPEFNKIEHYFGTVGIYGASEANGYFIKGFMVERE